MIRNLLTGLCIVVVAPAAVFLYARYEARHAQQDPSRSPLAWEPRFRQWDRDADGRLTRGEIPSGAMCRHMDTDHNGYVTPSEARAYFERRRAGYVDPVVPLAREPRQPAPNMQAGTPGGTAPRVAAAPATPKAGPPALRRPRGQRARNRRPRGT